MKIKSKNFVKGITQKSDMVFDNLAQVAFVGRSNVGKSSLVNSLLGAKALARTGKMAGKTTEINFYEVNDKFYLADLPGYGYARGGKDQQDNIRGMIIEYLTLEDFKPRTVALVLDSKVGITDFDRDMLDILEDNHHHAIIILNKVDKINQKELADQMNAVKRECGHLEVFPYSTIEQRGKKMLLQKLLEK